jgi:hypothetical protein
MLGKVVQGFRRDEDITRSWAIDNRFGMGKKTWDR